MQEREESNFKRLLTFSLRELLNRFNGLNAIRIQQAFNRIVSSFGDFTFRDIDFNDWDNLIAYFYAYSLLNTSTAFSRFTHVFVNWPDHQILTQRESLNVISLGGGPGTDMIGFCSALQTSFPNSFNSIDFNIVEMSNNWEDLGRIIEREIPQRNYGAISDIFKNTGINISFIQADVTVDPRMQMNYAEKLSESDVVLLVRFLDLHPFEIREGILMKIFEGMKDGAILMIIDSSTKVEECSNLRGSIIWPPMNVNGIPLLPTFTLSVQQARLDYLHINPRYESAANRVYILRKGMQKRNA